MEAATSAPAAAEAEGQVQGQQAEGEQSPEVGIQEWQQGIDTRLGESLDSIRQLAEVVQTRLPEPQAEQAPDFDAQFQELFDQSGGFPDPAQLQGLIQEQIKSGIREAVQPFQQQFEAVNDKMTVQEWGALGSRHPELRDPAKDRSGHTAADRLVETVASRAAEWGAPHLGNNAEFAEMVHMAEMAMQRAQQETPAGQGAIPQIETGGGAAPASSGGDEWDAILNLGRKGPVW